MAADAAEQAFRRVLEEFHGGGPLLSPAGQCEGPKRFNVPYRMDALCPECKRAAHRDFARDDYFSHPRLSTKPTVEAVGFYCAHCDHEWEHKVEIRVHLRLLEDDA